MGNVSEHLFAHSPKNICISSLVLYELQVGIAKSNNPKKREIQLLELLEQVNVLKFSQKEAKAAALIRADLEKKGKSIGPIDTLIAGSAKAHNCILVTHNTHEFERVNGLVLEDWF